MGAYNHMPVVLVKKILYEIGGFHRTVVFCILKRHISEKVEAFF